MAVAEVAGYGQISAGNAKEIYAAWKKGEVELSVSQQKYTESFLSPEEMDQIEYDLGSAGAQKKGAEKIDTSGADKNQAASATGATVAAGGSLALGLMFGTAAKAAITPAKAGSDVSATALIFGGVAAAMSALCLVSAKLFDTAYNERCKARDNSEQTNATIDGYSNALIDTMDMMSEDMDTYQAQQEELTLTVNDNTSEMASLSIQIADMEAAGDLEGAKQLKEQLKACEEMDTSSMEEGLEETSGRLEEYSAANSESVGVAGAGQTVSTFLQEGKTLGTLGTINAIALGITTAISGLCIPRSAASWKVIFDLPIALAASALFVVATALFGTSTKIMSDKAKNEFDCGSAGSGMQGHVDGLNNMIPEQNDYIDSTAESYEESDEKAAESQSEAQEKAAESEEKAAKTRPGRIEKEDGKDDEEDDDDKGTGAGAGTGAGTGAAA